MATFTVRNELKSAMLNKVFRLSGSANKIWVAVKTSSDGFEAQEVEFTYASGGITQNTSVINFLVDADITISTIKIADTKVNAEDVDDSKALAVVLLTGGDQVEFEEVGAYVIAELKIQLI